jgi:hypothetical protein
MKKLLTTITLIFLIVTFFDGIAFAQKGNVTGIVKNQRNYAIPGLTVYLVHPEVGRSSPSITDNFGRFHFYNVPLRNSPYYIEIYWGRDLVFRNSALIDGNIDLGKIKL